MKLKHSPEFPTANAGMDPSNAESQVDLVEGLFTLVLTEAVTATRTPEQIRTTFAQYIKLDLIDNPVSICQRADLIRELFRLANVGIQSRKSLTRGRNILHKQGTANHQSARQKYLTVIIESALSASGGSDRPDPRHSRVELTCTQAA